MAHLFVAAAPPDELEPLLRRKNVVMRACRRAPAPAAGLTSGAVCAGARLVGARVGAPRLRPEDATRMFDYCSRLRAQFHNAYQLSQGGSGGGGGGAGESAAPPYAATSL